MNELHGVSETYYEAAPDHIKQLAQEFFTAMDHDGDGQISRQEFVAFMNTEGHPQMSNPQIFKLLSKDGSGNSLNFGEVMTLFYIIKSGRPICGGCADFVEGLYFTCVKCFDEESNTFNVCSTCFKSRLYVHSHHQFLDNFVLLESKRMTALTEKQTAKEMKASTWTPPVAVTLEPCSSSREIVLGNTMSKRKIAWQGFNSVINIASMFSSLNSCGIM